MIVGRTVAPALFLSAMMAGLSFSATPGAAGQRSLQHFVQQNASMKTYRLAITGSDQATFSAECATTRGSGEEKFVFDGQPPFSREFGGEGLSCRIVQQGAAGSLEVEISSDSGNRSRSRTQGLGSTITLSMR